MRSTNLGRLLLIVALAVYALTLDHSKLLAAAPKHDASHEHSTTSEHGGGGEGDRLAFTGYKRYDLGIYTLLVFGILLFILSKYAWPHIKQGLEKREAMIRSAHEDAKQDRINAEAKLVEAKRQLDQAAAKAKEILDEARKAADVLHANEKEVGIKEAEARKQQAEREIAAMKDTLLKDVYDKAVQLATLMSEKALRREVSSADHSRLLDESLAELRAANKA